MVIPECHPIHTGDEDLQAQVNEYVDSGFITDEHIADPRRCAEG